MKRTIWILMLLVGWGSRTTAQQQFSVPTTDSISIATLVKQIELLTSYKVYIAVDTLFKVKVNNSNASPEVILKEALRSTAYRISVVGERIFVLPDKELYVLLPSKLIGKAPEEEDSQMVIATEKATSENRVYNIGNAYAEDKTTKAVIKGRVTDFKTGEPLPGINLIHHDPWIATVTDKEGRYSMELPKGKTQLEISGMNIKDTRRQLMILGEGNIDFELEEETHFLGEVTITSGHIRNVESTQLGVEKLRPVLLKNIPMALGEVDILKAVQSLPGVKTVGEVSSGFNVRGGATDQNLILLNDGTIYNANHLFGFFSAFSPDMVNEAEIYKSSIPAKFGGRISSVLDITGKEAGKEKFAGSAGIGLVTSKLNLDIPVIKGRTSLLLSGRTTYSDWILKMLPEKSGYKDGTAGFVDAGTVLAHTINKKNWLNIYGYYSHDRFAFNHHEKYAYSNLNASLKWRSAFSEKLLGNFVVGYDHYDYKNDETSNEAAAARLSFGINQVFAKADFVWKMSRGYTSNFGFKSMLYDISGGAYEPLGKNSLVKADVLQKDKALESALYWGHEWEVTSQLSINAGIRYSMFNAIGPRSYYSYEEGYLPSVSLIQDTLSVGSGKVIKTYHGPELRLSMRYTFTDNFSFKVGFNSMRQYIHRLSNTVIMSPTDTWKLSDMNIKPQRGWQLATGVYWSAADNALELSLEGYYKRMSDYLDYRNAARLLMNHHLETDVVPTEGYAYGVEFQVKKPSGKLNGWLGYTYSRTFLRQCNSLISNPVNNGEWYPTEYDKPHDVKLVGNYRFTKRYSLSVNMDYATGRPTTIPVGQYFDRELNSMQVYYTNRNSYRIPDYFRVDLSFNIEPSHKLTLLTHSSISIGIYNVTGRKNVYSIYYVSEEGKLNGYKMSIFGVPIPFVTYNIKF